MQASELTGSLLSGKMANKGEGREWISDTELSFHFKAQHRNKWEHCKLTFIKSKDISSLQKKKRF